MDNTCTAFQERVNVKVWSRMKVKIWSSLKLTVFAGITSIFAVPLAYISTGTAFLAWCVAALALYNGVVGFLSALGTPLNLAEKKLKEIVGGTRGGFLFWTSLVLLAAFMLYGFIRSADQPARYGSADKQLTTWGLATEEAPILYLFTAIIALIIVVTHTDFKDNEDEQFKDDGINDKDDFVGQEKFKAKLHSWEKYVEAVTSIQQARKHTDDIEKINIDDMHMVLFGNPGTGKTAGARLIAKMLAKYGIIKNKFIECNATDLVGQARGQSAAKTRAMIQKAQNGILFIDEAYYLDPKGPLGDLGGEALAELLVKLDKSRGSFICIIAGYKKQLTEMMLANPGLKSRFTHWVEFEDYTVEQLYKMLEKMVKRDKREIEPDCVVAIKGYIKQWCVTGDVPEQARGLRKLYSEASKRFIMRKADLYKDIRDCKRSDGEISRMKFSDFAADQVKACNGDEDQIKACKETLKRKFDSFPLSKDYNWDAADEDCQKRRKTMLTQDFQVERGTLM